MNLEVELLQDPQSGKWFARVEIPIPVLKVLEFAKLPDYRMLGWIAHVVGQAEEHAIKNAQGVDDLDLDSLEQLFSEES